MKLTSDNKQVPDRCYCYLLDWNEADEKVAINKYFNKNRLCDLDEVQFWNLFSYASKCDFNNMSVDSISRNI